MLSAGMGLLIVVEWDREASTEAICLLLSERGAPDGWLRRRLGAGLTPGQPWQTAFQGWAVEHGFPGTRQDARRRT